MHGRMLGAGVAFDASDADVPWLVKLADQALAMARAAGEMPASRQAMH